MMMTFQWNGEAMEPQPRFRKRCDEKFVVGEIYHMEAKEFRSLKSHNQYFAAVNEYWKNLPEILGDQFPSPDHLRSYALIKCGYYNEQSIALSAKSDALEVVALAKSLNNFSVATVKENVVQVFTAKSQATKAMNNKEFQASKTAVLDFLERLVGADALAFLEDAA